MKPKAILLSLIGLVLIGGVVFLYSANRRQAGQLQTLNTQLRLLAEQLDQAQREKNERLLVMQEEIDRLRKDNQELLKLRNEVRQLREERDQLARQAQAAQAQAQRAQAQVAAAQSQLEALRTNAPPPQPGPQVANPQASQESPETLRVKCINTLRIIDAAKQAWALENRKPVNSIPTQQDLLPYLGSAAFPTCPAGGTYMLNPVNTVPTCSIPGHVLQ